MAVEQILARHAPEFDPPVRGDPITGERYWSKDYMNLETKNLWPRVWHLGGMVAELHEANSPIDDRIKAAQTLRPIIRYRPSMPTRTIISAIPTVCLGIQIVCNDPDVRRHT